MLAESLDNLRTRLGQRTAGQLRLPKLCIDLPRVAHATFADAIWLRLLEKSTESFWAGLGHLKAYVSEFADARVHQDFKGEDGFALGNWVADRRAKYQAQQLSQEHIDALNEIGFIWDTEEFYFQEGLSHLKAYITEVGDARVPARFKTKDW